MASKNKCRTNFQ